MKDKTLKNETNDAKDFYFTIHIHVLDVIHVNEKKKSQQKCNQEINECSILDRKSHNESIQNDFEKNVQYRN